jgi:predicted permease
MNDLRYAARQLRRTPGLTLAAVATLGIGIGATTAIFSMIHAILLRPLPVADPGRLVSIQEQTAERRFRSSVSLPEYLEYRDRAAGAVAIAAHHLADIMLNTGTQASATIALDVSGNYFAVAGIEPALGRFFTDEEARGPGAAAVVVISHDLWQDAFGGDRGVLGRAVHVNSHPLTVIGVAPRGFHGTMLGARPRVWLPVGLYDRLHPGRDPYSWGRMTWLQLFGRLQPGIEARQAEAALTVIAGQLAATHEYQDGETPIGVRIRAFSALPPGLRDGVRGFVTLLLVTAGLVLAIAAVNVSAMLLARGTSRAREMAIRVALGARRPRLVVQLLVESVTLAVLGGAAGLVLAVWLTEVMAAVRPPFAGPFALDLGLDGRVLVFAALVSMLTGVTFGLAPALHAIRRQVSETLKDGATHHRRTRLRSVMVAGQLALSLVLLVAAGLFVRTLHSALHVRHGFDPQGVLAIELNLRLNRYDEARGRAFYSELLERVRALPGAESAALAEVIPLGFSWEQTRVHVPRFDPPPGEPGFAVGYNVVTPEYFETLRMPLLAGRSFTEADREDRQPVLVINRTFAHRFWPADSPIGKRVRWGRVDAEIVGVVPDGKYRSYSEGLTLFAYVPFAQEYAHEMWLHVRHRGDMAASIVGIRRAISALDPNVAPIAVSTVEEVLGASLFAQRLAAWLIGGFGLAGLILAAVGVFGLLSFTVAQRTREIGLRVALGAERRAVIGLVLRDGLRLLGAGVVIGLGAAVATTRVLGGLLHGVSPNDPLTLGVMCAVLGLVTVTAALLPARRAARIEPMEALRWE